MFKKIITLSLSTLMVIVSVSCGDEEESSNGNRNIYNYISLQARSIQGSDVEYTAAKAVAYMNARKEDKAIECLQEYLDDHPGVIAIQSLLVSAYFQKADI